MKRNRVLVGFLCCFGCGGGVRVGVAPEETAVLVGWRRRSDNHVLVRMKTEAILYASEGVGIDIIAKMVERTEKTVQEWPAEWQTTRMCSVPAGHAGNQDAAEPARAQKQGLRAVLARPSSRTGARAEFWDVPAVRDVVRILFDVEHQAGSSHRLLLRLCGPSPEPPGPVRRAPRRESHHPAHGLGDDPGQGPAGRRLGGPHRKARSTPQGEVRLEHEAETRRMQPPKGQRTKLSVDRQKTSQSFPGALSLTGKKVAPYPTGGTGTPGRQSSHRNGFNEKPRPARSRSSWTTPAPTTRKR